MKSYNNIQSARLAAMPLLVLSFLLSLSSCGPSGDNFRIDGKVRGMQGGQIFVCVESNGEEARFDTIMVKEERFRYNGHTSETTPVLLIFPNGLEQAIIAGPGDALRYEASATDLANYTVKGSDENKALTDFRQSLRGKDEAAARARARRFIQKQPQLTASVWLFSRYFMQDSSVGERDMQPLLKLLRTHHPTNHYLLSAAASLKLLSRGKVGSKVPNVTVTAASGAQIQLNKPRAPHTVLLYWASWMPQQWNWLGLVRSQKQEQKDKLDVVAISLDTQIYEWEDIIRTDSATVRHACDGLAWDSPAVSRLGVRAIPTWFLIDRQAHIVSRGTSIDSLEQQLLRTSE